MTVDMAAREITLFYSGYERVVSKVLEKLGIRKPENPSCKTKSQVINCYYNYKRKPYYFYV